MSDGTGWLRISVKLLPPPTYRNCRGVGRSGAQVSSAGRPCVQNPERHAVDRFHPRRRRCTCGKADSRWDSLSYAAAVRRLVAMVASHLPPSNDRSWTDKMWRR